MSKIGVQGGYGSYHEAAARQLHPDTELVYFDTFSDVFGALRSHVIDSAVVAFANNRAQFIPEPYQELTKISHDITIIGETYLRIDHALLGIPGTDLGQIAEVHSQTPALDQCRNFLGTHLPDAAIIEQHDTAASAALVAAWNDPTKAAIASATAGKLHGLVPLRTHIQDDIQNVTRFLELTIQDILQDHQDHQDATKTTMQIQTPQTPGALVDVLQLFKNARINLSYIQSSFIPNTAFDVQFFLEFEAGLQDASVQAILQTLQDTKHEVTVLGSYVAATIPITEK